VKQKFTLILGCVIISIFISGCSNTSANLSQAVLSITSTPTETPIITPTVTPIVSPTEAPTAVPTIKPTAPLSNKEQDSVARKAYDKMLSEENYKMDDGTVLGSMKEVEFWIADINGDNISELFLYNPLEARGWMFDMYYYHDGKLIDSESYGSGMMSYYNGTGVFISRAFNMGTGFDIYCQFDGSGAKTLGMIKSGEDTKYSIGDKVVSHKEFLQAIEKWTNGVKIIDIEWDYIKNTKQNREKYILKL